MVKYADDISLSIPVGAKLNQADSESEVKSIMEWAKNNRMSLNLGKTWEMLMKGKTEKDQPDPLQYIKRKSNLKLLGVTFEDNPTNWDTHFDYMLSKASSRLYIACSAGVFWARVHIFLLGFHLRFGNCGGLGRGNICRGSRS